MKLLLLASFLICLENSKVDSSQKDVYAAIFEGYQNDLRPVHNDSTQMIIQIQPQIMSLLEVNEDQEYIKVAIYINQWWKDEYLTWDPLHFNGTTTIKVPASKVWLPDIIVASTSLEPEYFISVDDRIVEISYDGSVYISFPFVLTNYCKMKTDEYPFDTQECIIVIVSWAYVTKEVSLQHNIISDGDGDINAPINNSTVWDILPYVYEAVEVPDGLEQTVMQLSYRQKLKRKPQYYVWVLIMPTFIVTALSLAGIYAPFNNSGDREDKTTLGLTTLLTLAILLTMVAGEMPRGSTLPLLGRFVLIEIVMIVVCMAISMVTMFYHQRATTRSWRVPSWLMSIMLCNPQRTSRIADKQKMISEIASRENLDLEVPLDSNSQSTSDQVILLRACLRRLNETYARVNGWLNGNEEEKGREHHWLLIFDRLDLSLFIFFQLIHLISFVIIFYQYFGSFH